MGEAEALVYEGNFVGGNLVSYKIQLTEEQIRVVQNALEEYFRLRMGQVIDFCDDIAGINTDVYKKVSGSWVKQTNLSNVFNLESNLSANYSDIDKAFDSYIHRRNHLEEILKAFFRIAFEPEGYLKQKTEDMLIAEDIWDAIRTKRGLSRWGDVSLQLSKEPVPKIEYEPEPFIEKKGE